MSKCEIAIGQWKGLKSEVTAKLQSLIKYGRIIQFFQIGAELSLNSVNSGKLIITGAWIGLGLKILSLMDVLLVLWKHPCLLHKRWLSGWFESFYCNDNFFVTGSTNQLNSLNSVETFIIINESVNTEHAIRSWGHKNRNIHQFNWYTSTLKRCTK